MKNKQNIENNALEEKLPSLQRRKILKNTKKLIYSAPVFLILSSPSDAGLTPPDPPSSDLRPNGQTTEFSN